MGTAEIDVEGHRLASPLTAREREVADLIRLGLTNRQIGAKLYISERTVDAHVQNTLNKLGAKNRAQIAAWSMEAWLESPPELGGRTVENAPAPLPTIAAATPPATSMRPSTLFWRRRLGLLVALLAALAIVVVATSDGLWQQEGGLPPNVGQLAYRVNFTSGGEGFDLPASAGDPTASAVRFSKGAVEYSVVKPGGYISTNLTVGQLPRYFAQVELAVVPGSSVEFWINLDRASSPDTGSHLIEVGTLAEVVQLKYFVRGQRAEGLGPQIHKEGLQSGRAFTISALVAPPLYQVYLDRKLVISVEHKPLGTYLAPSFAIFGDGTGTVRLTDLRVYHLR